MALEGYDVADFTRMLDSAWAIYKSNVKRLAETAFRHHVEPFLKKHGLEFISGGDAWWIEKPGAPAAVSQKCLLTSQADPEWHAILPLLEYKPEGYEDYGIELGAFMPCYPPKKEAGDKPYTEWPMVTNDG